MDIQQRLDIPPFSQAKWVATVLMVSGFVLYLYAGTIVYSPLRQLITGNGQSWNPDELQQTAWAIRGFAALFVIGGYAERILAALRSR